jgi:hypothetical protein
VNDEEDVNKVIKYFCYDHVYVLLQFLGIVSKMMDIIKPANGEHLVVEGFLQPHCSQLEHCFAALVVIRSLMAETRG